MQGSLMFVMAMVLAPMVALANEPEKAPEIIVWNGTAFSWPVGNRDKFKDGDPITSWDVVAAFTGQTLMRADCAKFSHMHKGSRWCFTSQTNLEAFKNATDKDGDNPMVPRFGGRCLLGTSWGIAAARGDPRTFRLIGGELVLQSHNKWWNEFDHDRPLNERLARLSIQIYRTMGVIVPNYMLPSVGMVKQGN